jgi:hypothetical protein
MFYHLQLEKRRRNMFRIENIKFLLGRIHFLLIASSRSVFLGLVLCFMLAPTASAQTTYGYTHTPGVIDVVTQGGNPKTLVIQIANLTPYAMKLTNFSPTLHDEIDRSRHTAKSFMFAPLGLPQNIPPVMGDPANAKPYTAVLAWDDGGTADDKYAVNNWLIYTLSGVDCTDPLLCTVDKEDVDIGLWVTRSNPDKSLDAKYYFQLARNILHEVFALVGVIVFPEIPLSWANFIIGGAELEKTSYQFNAEQKAGDVGHQWYIASYAVPSKTSLCYNAAISGCYPSPAIADDAIETNWGAANAGPTQSRIVVITQVRRGKSAQPSEKYGCSQYWSSWGSLGSAPVAMVTVTTTDVWYPAVMAAMAKCSATPTPDYCPTPSAVASLRDAPRFSRPPACSAVSDALPMIHTILKEHGRDGLLALASVVRSLNPVHRQLLAEMFQKWRASESFTPQDEALLHLIAVRLRKEVR